MNEDQRHYLPGSLQRYSVDNEGRIFDGEVELTPSLVSNARVATLTWLGQKKAFTIDSIIVAAYFKAALPREYIEKVELIYNDNDENNLSLGNLAYRFTDAPLESKEFPGFYYVPYYTKYLVNQKGEVLSLRLLERNRKSLLKKWTPSKPVARKNIKGGYMVGRGVRDHDLVDGVSRHRFMALTFIHYESDPLSLVVNHKDGIPGNDTISNLEWVTYSENTKHAYRNNLHPEKVRPIVFLNEKTGVESHFATVAECTVALNVTVGFINGRLDNPHKDYGDGMRFKAAGTDWKPYSDKGVSNFIRSVISRDIETGEMIIHSSAVDAAKHFNVSSALVSLHCREVRFTPTNGVCYRFSTDAGSWPIYSEYHLKIFKRFPGHRYPHGYFLIDDLEQIVKFYESAEDLAEEHDLKVSAVKLSKRVPCFAAGLRVRSFDPYLPL